MQNFDKLFKKVNLVILVLILTTTSSALKAQTIYALNGTNLLSFGATNPQLVTGIVPITGIASGKTIIGMDVRPSTGQLYAIANDSNDSTAIVYTINTTSGLATALDSTLFLPLGNGSVGFDFNPVSDRIRVSGGSDLVNYRLDPETGALLAIDSSLFYSPGDLFFGRTPAIGSVAYTNSYRNAPNTILYAYDDSLNTLVIQNPPNDGQLITVGGSGIVLNKANASGDMDIYFDTTLNANIGYMVANVNTSNNDNLYKIDLSTGSTTLVGAIGLLGFAITDIAIAIDTNLHIGINETYKQAINWGINPNPSVNETTINFELISASKVKIVTFDQTGRMVSSLENSYPAGLQKEMLNTTELTSGTYIINIYVNNTIKGISKLVVTK